MANEAIRLNAAIYCRKSSEEGLEQSFNSLDAQREACEAFVISQRQEGWRPLATRYDDGGYSGGSLERPALQKLLAAVKDGTVTVIVVYKVDRLTRSLADFAKIIEILDANRASFVSVTQQFNTTSSMGRLTLNVLLSFAQFEREVTGERIRDKIAASKKKGMWMGGFPPLGYDVKDRQLLPNASEAAVVQKIFSLYLQLGSVSSLKEELNRTNIRSKLWTCTGGTARGGAKFSRGALYDLLQNKLYLGEVRHRNVWYPGLHRSIVPRDLWERAQSQMKANRHERSVHLLEHSSSLLTGFIEDIRGNRYTASFTVKNKRRYRYYVCRASSGDSGQHGQIPARLPAKDLETLATDRIRAFFNSESEVFDEYQDGAFGKNAQQLVAKSKVCARRWQKLTQPEVKAFVRVCLRRVVISDTSLDVILHKQALAAYLLRTPAQEGQTSVPDEDRNGIRLRVEMNWRRCGGETCLLIPAREGERKVLCRPVPSLVKAVVRAHSWYDRLLDGRVTNCDELATKLGLGTSYVSRVLPFASLAPDIAEAILNGTQPPDLSFAKMARNIPLSWTEQRKRFGFPPARLQ